MNNLSDSLMNRGCFKTFSYLFCFYFVISPLILRRNFVSRKLSVGFF